MSTYKPKHLGHGVMRAMAAGPISESEIVHSFSTGWSMRKLRAKVHGILEALRRDELAKSTGDGHELTADGQLALARLDAGHAVCTDPAEPTVRIFARAA